MQQQWIPEVNDRLIKRTAGNDPDLAVQWGMQVLVYHYHRRPDPVPPEGMRGEATTVSIIAGRHPSSEWNTSGHYGASISWLIEVSKGFISLQNNISIEFSCHKELGDFIPFTVSIPLTIFWTLEKILVRWI